MSPPKTYPVQQMPQQNYLTSNTGYLFSNPTGSIPSTHQTTFPNPPISQSYKSS